MKQMHWSAKHALMEEDGFELISQPEEYWVSWVTHKDCQGEAALPSSAPWRWVNIYEGGVPVLRRICPSGDQRGLDPPQLQEPPESPPHQIGEGFELMEADHMKVLFEDGDWKIGRDINDRTLLVHVCPSSPSKNGMSWWLPSRGGCQWCDIKAPDEIIGLALLTDWDR